MPITEVYKARSRGVLLAGRDLEEALLDGDEDEIRAGRAHLLNAALAREGAGAVAAFQAENAPAGPSTPGIEEELSVVLTELEVGSLLLAGSAAPASSSPEAATVLGDAADRLETASAELAVAGTPAVRGLFGQSRPDAASFYKLLPQTVDDVVTRTAQLGSSVVGGLTKLPAAHLHPVLAGATALLPDDIGALAAAGLRAIKRAVEALRALVPANLWDTAVSWAREWWTEHAAEAIRDVVRVALSVVPLEEQIARRFPPDRPLDGSADAALQTGASELLTLGERHARLVKIIDMIVHALSRVIGPLILVVPAVAAWAYLCAGTGLLAALGIGVWIGRDCLDSGVPFERIAGVRTIMASVADR